MAIASQALPKWGALKDTETPQQARRAGVYRVVRDEAGRSAGTGGRPSQTAVVRATIALALTVRLVIYIVSPSHWAATSNLSRIPLVRSPITRKRADGSSLLVPLGFFDPSFWTEGACRLPRCNEPTGFLFRVIGAI